MTQCDNVLERPHQPARHQKRLPLGFKRRKRLHKSLRLHVGIENIHHRSRSSISADTRGNNRPHAFQAWSMAVAGVEREAVHLCPPAVEKQVKAIQLFRRPFIFATLC
jgi:hypothetical protein